MTLITKSTFTLLGWVFKGTVFQQNRWGGRKNPQKKCRPSRPLKTLMKPKKTQKMSSFLFVFLWTC